MMNGDMSYRESYGDFSVNMTRNRAWCEVEFSRFSITSEVAQAMTIAGTKEEVSKVLHHIADTLDAVWDRLQLETPKMQG